MYKRQYNDFVYGHGFKDPGIYRLRLNKEVEKLDKILRMVCKDFTVWPVSYTHLLSTHKHWTALAYTKLKIFKNESKTL